MGMSMMQQTGNPNAGLITFEIWLNNVRPGGRWDYKLTGKSGTEAAGNFNFGATGSMFFSPITLISGAGVVQLATNPANSSGGIPFFLAPYGDDAVNDIPNILAGINGGC